MFKHLAITGSTIVATAAIVLAAGGNAALAEGVPIENAGSGTFQSTSELGTGAMTSYADFVSPGGADQGEHPDSYQFDYYGRVGGGIQVEGGRSYIVTVTLDDAYAEESATGSAVARGFVSVDLYDCCFAGEADLITGSEAELPASPGQVQVSMEVLMPDDGSLNVDIQLHSYISLFVDTTDEAHVRAFAGASRIDITTVGEPAPETTTPATTIAPTPTTAPGGGEPTTTVPPVTEPTTTVPTVTVPPTTAPAATTPPTTNAPIVCVLGICL